MELTQALDLFLTDKRSYCAASTIKYYVSNLNFFINFCHSNNFFSVHDLNSDLLRSFVLYLRDSGCKNTSVNTYFRAVRAFCSFLIENEYIPYFKYKIKLPRPDPELVLPLSSKEVSLLFEYINKYSPDSIRNMVIVRLMLDLGLRSSEVRHLRVSDVFFDKKYIIIRNSKYNKSRSIPLPDCVSQILLDLISQDNLSADDLFIPLSESAIKSIFYRLKIGTGITRLHAHLLRHTFATSYMYYRNNLEFCRLYLGHSSYSVTQNYLHLSSQLLITHADIYKIDDIFI